MKIKEIRIENFGKFSGFSRTFTDGINTVIEENGWGKSTLTAFIRVMFFGFDNENARTKTDREREHFRPWQGGTYGGSIIFETNGKEYRMNRTFGSRPAEDTFALYDNRTNVSSEDYSEKIGEELFELNAESFKRTVFINQNDVETNATDGINAKISSLSGTTDDIENYEAVVEKINNKLNSLTSRRNTGALYKLNNEIAALENDTRIISSVEANISSTTKTLEGLKKELDANKSKTEELSEELRESSKAETLNSKKGQYKGICERYNARKGEEEKTKAVFINGIPDGEELNRYIEESKNIHQSELKALSGKPSLEEEALLIREGSIFVSKVPSYDEIETYKEKAGIITEKEKQYASLQFSAEEKEDYEKYSKKFNGRTDIEETITSLLGKFSESNAKKATIGDRKNLLENYTHMCENKTNSPWLVMIICGIIALAAGAVLMFAVSMTIGAIVLGAAAILIIAGFITKRTDERKKNESDIVSKRDELDKSIMEDESFIRNTENEVRAFLGKFNILFEESTAFVVLSDIKNECRRYRSLVDKEADQRDDTLLLEINSEKRELDAFLAPYADLFISEKDYSSKLNTLKFKSENYTKLKNKKEQFDSDMTDIAGRKQPVLDYIRSIGFAGGETDLTAKLRDINEKLDEYKKALSELSAVEREKNDFESTNNILEITSSAVIPGMRSVEEINEMLKTAASEKDGISENITYYKGQLSEDYEKLDNLNEKKDALADKTELLEKLKKRERLISKTKEILMKAKENFTGKYCSSVANGFKKYYELAEGTTGNEYSFDANMNLMIDDHGGYKNISSYSSGSRDKIGLCFRMGLIEAMYSEEKPVIVMDDPFTNLDERRIEGGRKILDTLKNDYQVIYLTCHDSRMPGKS